MAGYLDWAIEMPPRRRPGGRLHITRVPHFSLACVEVVERRGGSYVALSLAPSARFVGLDSDHVSRYCDFVDTVELPGSVPLI